MQMQNINFLIIGAAKSATTWLQKSLQADPSIFMPDPELHYFSREHHRGDDWYLSQFSGRRTGQIVGEKSNSYLNTTGSAALIHKSLPQVKLIAQLRNPVDRAYSDYCMLYRRGEVSGDIDRHLDPRNAAGGRFLADGMYSRQIEEFLNYYSRQNLLLLTYENTIADAEAQLRSLRAFLGLDFSPSQHMPSVSKVKDKTTPMISPRLKRAFGWLKPAIAPFRSTPLLKSLHRNLAREITYPPLAPELRARLLDFYKKEMEALESLMGRRIEEWPRS